MKILRKFVIVIFLGLFFWQPIFAVGKIIYPNQTPLQAILKDVAPSASDMNTNQATEIKSNLDSSGKTLDSIKLTESAKAGKNILTKKLEKSNIFIYITIGLLIIFTIIFAFNKIKK